MNSKENKMPTKRQEIARVENWIIFMLKGMKASISHYGWITASKKMGTIVVLDSLIIHIDQAIEAIKNIQIERRMKLDKQGNKKP